MSKKWTIDKGEPIKVRLVQETERADEGEGLCDRPIRVKIKSRLLRLIVTLIALALGISCR